MSVALVKNKAARAARAKNKVARARRRDDIIVRWRRREVLRDIGRFLAKLPSRSPEQITGGLMHYAGEVPLEYLVGVLSEQDITREMIVYLMRVIQLKEMPYDEYLQTPEWKHRANYAKKQYQGRCGLDDSHIAIDAHHRTYERRGREFVGDLIPLCRECHARFHKK